MAVDSRTEFRGGGRKSRADLVAGEWEVLAGGWNLCRVQFFHLQNFPVFPF